MILGLRTAMYPVTDLDAGKKWYSDIFGTVPYFSEPYYVGFNIGGFELGLVPDGSPGRNGARVYLGVNDVVKELERLLTLGAKLHEEVQDVGGGIKVASVVDPFGNVLGIIENPHFDPKAVR